MDIKEMAKTAYEGLSDKKGENIKVLDISEISVISDYFVIASGNNINHVKTLAHSVEEKLAENGVHLKHKEGHQTASWILLDFGSVIVHVFGKAEREFYDLEHIWGDAREVNMQNS